MISKDAVSGIGRSGINLAQALKYILRGNLNLKETAVQINKAGIGSIFIVSITAMFIGLALSTQMAQELARRFGAEHLVGGIIGVAVIRELAPVITSIVVAGRVGAAITAEIGSMKVSEQIEALIVLGINPIKYLVVPRLIASSIITPLLSVVAAILSILAGMILTKYAVNLNYGIYLDSTRSFVEVKDLFIMALKAFVFGITITIIATTTALNVSGGAEAVGNAATKTVVWSIIFIFAFNYVITSLFFGA